MFISVWRRHTRAVGCQATQMSDHTNTIQNALSHYPSMFQYNRYIETNLCIINVPCALSCVLTLLSCGVKEGRYMSIGVPQKGRGRQNSFLTRSFPIPWFIASYMTAIIFFTFVFIFTLVKIISFTTTHFAARERNWI